MKQLKKALPSVIDIMMVLGRGKFSKQGEDNSSIQDGLSLALQANRKSWCMA
jgi:hypothetical protein